MIKGCPAQVGGPLGPWYRKVNETVAQAQICTSGAKLRQLMGEPDETVLIPDEDRREDATAPVDSRHPEVLWIYRDPYRPRMQYEFGISGDVVVSRSRTTKA